MFFLLKPIPVFFGLIQPFPPDYFQQEIVVIPATAETS
jgi:hypothetical protein